MLFVVLGIVVLALVAGGVVVGVLVHNRNAGGGSAANVPLTDLIDYRTSHPDWLKTDHQEGPISYPMVPPAGGPHHSRWQNCMGDVYDKPIDQGNAVHSLEHGAVWITYQPDIEKTEIETLASKVRGGQFIMMSPYGGLSTKVSMQAWGYQLKIIDIHDKRIDGFIARFRQKASVETGAACSNGETTTG